jgi:predicted ATPase/class 3 adenylate cyclase/DNA-binding CsgD family transcriptional regulator
LPWQAAAISGFSTMFSGSAGHMLASMSGPDARTDPLNWSDLGVSELPSGTVTLLLADIEGSTGLWESSPKEMAEAVARLDRTLTDTVAAHDGVRPVEQGEGDSFVVAFARASDAAACAIALQRSPLAPIRLRIGLHTGEVRLRDEGNYIGPTINRTARLRDLAHGGQTVLSGVTDGLVADHLPEDAWLTDLGTHRLRDVARPERVTQLCHPDLRNDFPPLRVSEMGTAPRLPAQITSFVGRGAQIIEIGQLLTEHRFVTLTGAGGAGKTRLAIEIAGRLAEEFSDGVWYADLAPLTHPDLVPVTVARAMGLPDQPGRSALDSLVRYIGNRSMLVVMDNCEHLPDACAQLASALLDACATLTLFATSREPIRAFGEFTWSVPSLTLDTEAVELFTDRARQVRPDFAVTAENATTVTEICRRLDGMPLAIELAAARIRALSLQEIMDSLHDRFRLLTGGARTAVRRQQTLRASVDWSHALLTEPERILFRRLAVFLGGFDLDAAQAVAGDADVQRYQILDQLALLVDKSLVVAENISGRTRYRFLETVRQYALEKLGESGEAATVRSRHRDHFNALGALLDAPGRSDYDQRVDEADREMDNLRSAFGWSIETGEIEHALELASSLQPLWLSRGRIQEGRAWFDAVAAQTGPSEVAPTVRARALADKVVLDAWVGIHHLDDAQRALAITRELDDPALLVRALTACGSASVYDVAVARSYFDEAIGLARDLDDRWRLSQILSQQAQAELVAGDPPALRAAAEEGRDIADSVGDRFGSRQCRWRLGAALGFMGEFRAAVRLLHEVIAEAEIDHDVLVRVTAQLVLPHALSPLGDIRGARAAAGAAIESAADLGDVYLGGSYIGLMVAHLAAGDVELAMRAAEVGWSHVSGLYGTSSINAAYVAQTFLASGDLRSAWRMADESVATTTGMARAVALATRARVALAMGDSERAERDAHDALARAAAIKTLLGVPDILDMLAGLAGTVGSHQEAARRFGAAEGIRQRTGEVRFKIYQDSYQASVEVSRNTLGDKCFDDAWGEGTAMSTEAAIAFAQRGRGERKRPSTGWASLTPTECDVVSRVGEGLSNKDIAARLFISPRTVESHLTHVYTKLGITSRVQLAQEATRREDDVE